MTHWQNIARILNTPGVKGELAIQLDNSARCIVPFRSWVNHLKSGTNEATCVIGNMGDKEFMVGSNPQAAGIIVFDRDIADGWVVQIIPYRCVQLIWCHYPGKEGAE